jgi:hypothetical protein
MQERNSNRSGPAIGTATTAAPGVTVRSISSLPAARTLSASNTQSIKEAIKISQHATQPQQKSK